MIARRAVLAGLASWPALGALAEADAPLRRPPAVPAPSARRVVAASGLAGDVGHAIIDWQSGTLLEGSMALVPMPPASTTKALTALYALARLGPAHRFRTRVLRAGDMLVLAGGGDPVLSSDDLARLAADLVASGEPAPKRFAVWGGALPSIAEIAPEQADHLAYNPALSGMMLNFNRVHLGWRGGDGGPQLSLEARAARHSPRAYTISAIPGDQRDMFTYRADESREFWTIARSALRRPGSRWLPVRQPELYAGDVFQTLCRAQGFALPSPEVVDLLPVGSEVAALDSPPLTELLRGMLRHSTNLTAEAIGLAASGARDTAASGAAVRDWLHAQGLGAGFRLADHSGLSADSRVTALGLARAISQATGAADLALLLREEQQDEATPRSTPSYRVLAKTGTLNFVSNLAGHIDRPDGRLVSFAILCADLPRHAASRGQEQPEGVAAWTRQARQLHRRVVAQWAARWL